MGIESVGYAICVYKDIRLQIVFKDCIPLTYKKSQDELSEECERSKSVLSIQSRTKIQNKGNVKAINAEEE